jgi:hypothetical protein
MLLNTVLKSGCLVALLIVLVTGCTPSNGLKPQARSNPTAHAVAGGCAGTQLTVAEPPVWAQGGWIGTKGTPWPVPWAMGTPANAVAFLFATRLVAGVSPRSDGTNNKVLWVAKDAPTGFAVDGRPEGKTGPVISEPGGPSIVDLPSAGCWTFQLSGVPDGRAISTINLNVLPTGTSPRG